MMDTNNEVYAMAEMFVKDYGRYPSLIELADMGITRAKVRERYGSILTLNRLLAENLGEYIFDVSKASTKILKPAKKGRYILSTVVVGDEINRDFYLSLKTYAKKTKSTLAFLVSIKRRNSEYLVDPLLADDFFVLDETDLNKNLKVTGVASIASRVDPVSSLPRLNGYSVIAASPKQRLKFVATGVNVLPHAKMSTGAITMPNYTGKYFQQDRTTKMANADHRMGALVVEVIDDHRYHFRHVQMSADGSFNDLGVNYSSTGVRKVTPEALVTGDWHNGFTDPKVRATTFKMIKELAPNNVIMHDLFDGYSINPHVAGKQLLLSKMANQGILSLKGELELLKEEVTKLSGMTKRLVIVASNHDDFINRYLDKGSYVKHPYNADIAHELWGKKINGENVLEYYVNSRSKKKLNNVKWLKVDESFKVAGVELGQHGDRGANGAKGSISSLENAFVRCIVGHSHTPEILRNVAYVGTSSYLQLDYNKGASSWMQAHALVYQDGTFQIINFIDGKYTA